MEVAITKGDNSKSMQELMKKKRNMVVNNKRDKTENAELKY